MNGFPTWDIYTSYFFAVGDTLSLCGLIVIFTDGFTCFLGQCDWGDDPHAPSHLWDWGNAPLNTHQLIKTGVMLLSIIFGAAMMLFLVIFGTGVMLLLLLFRTRAMLLLLLCGTGTMRIFKNMPQSWQNWHYGIFRLQTTWKITINPKLETIDLSAFESCAGVNELIIPEGVLKVIQSQAFTCWCKIKRVEIPDNVTSIGSMMFMACVWLNDAILPQGIKEISDGVFMHCIE